MAIEKVRITNLLSFEDVEIDDLNDMNCIVGRNNSGKSNFLKALKYFYNRLEGKEELPPKLNSNYSYKGAISVTFDVTRLFRMSRRHPSNSYFSFIARKLVPLHQRGLFVLKRYNDDHTSFTLSLNIYSDGKVKWSTKDDQTRSLILYLFPFFHIEPRHMDLHEWDSLWDLISRIKSFNLSKMDDDSVIEFFDKSINSDGDSSYKSYVDDLNRTISTKPGTQKEKILSYIRAGLKGYKFEIDENDLKFNSDGTNSFHFVKTFLKILIAISRREYIVPFVFIDEPELGLHPKMNEILIHDIYKNYAYSKGRRGKTSRPKVFISTHSPNIVKEVIKRFRDKQRILCFRKKRDYPTSFSVLNSTYDSESFINIFSDNEARLFFSDFILFVEGESEMEVFCNEKLSNHFPHLSKVDVYKSSSNVVGERVNPYYSNSDVPYMFLFDADKAISVDGVVGDYSLKLKSNGNYFDFKPETLKRECRKYSFGFSRKYKDYLTNTETLIGCMDKKLRVNPVKQNFHPDEGFEDIFQAVKRRLFNKNIYINRTTLEGCLIQIDSSPIFFKWLKDKHSINVDPLILKVNSAESLTLDMLVDYLRVVFKGKTNILTNYKSFCWESYGKLVREGLPVKGNLKKTPRASKKLMKALERSTISSSKVGKADGWVTSFMNYAVDHIEEQCLIKEKKFGYVFKLHFPELYDIISRLQPDSRGKM